MEDGEFVCLRRLLPFTAPLPHGSPVTATPEVEARRRSCELHKVWSDPGGNLAGALVWPPQEPLFWEKDTWFSHSKWRRRTSVNPAQRIYMSSTGDSRDPDEQLKRFQSDPRNMKTLVTFAFLLLACSLHHYSDGQNLQLFTPWDYRLTLTCVCVCVCVCVCLQPKCHTMSCAVAVQQSAELVSLKTRWRTS